MKILTAVFILLGWAMVSALAVFVICALHLSMGWAIVVFVLAALFSLLTGITLADL